MAQTAQRKDRDERLELRDILNRWDPIGVFGNESVDWPEDEYESYVEPLLCQLRGGKSVEQLAQYLENLVRDFMGIDVEPGEAEMCADAAFEWFHRRWVH